MTELERLKKIYASQQKRVARLKERLPQEEKLLEKIAEMIVECTQSKEGQS